jgi:hypothetical protein
VLFKKTSFSKALITLPEEAERLSLIAGGSMRIIFLCSVLFSFHQAGAAAAKNTNVLAVGQGLSAPTSTSTINFSSGYTSESPLGTIYQNGFRLTGQYDSDENAGTTTKTYGAEVGYGQGDWGLAAGQRKSDCDNCEATSSGAVGINVADFGVGLRFGKDLTALALLINPHGGNRFGLMAELNKSGGSGNDITAYGIGYSYVASQLTFTIDASKRNFENKAITDDRIQVTPGLMLRADHFQLSVNDKITLNKDKNNATHDDEDHDIWFGIGFGGDKGHLAFYSQYVNDFAFAGTLFF